MLDAIVAGHLCADIIPTITTEMAASGSFMEPGRLTETGGLVVSTGGAVSNTGISLHRLGIKVGLVARIGKDTIGQLVRDLIAQEAPCLAEHLSQAEGEPSSYTIVISPPGTDRTFLHCPGTNNTFGPEDIADDLVAQTRLLHFGYPPLMRRMFADGGVELGRIMAQARAAGVTTSLDMAMPDPARPSGAADWAAICERVLPEVDLFVPSAEELLYMLRRERYDALAESVGQAAMLDALNDDDIRGLAEQALAMGARVVLLKLGHRGSYLRSGNLEGGCGRGFPKDLASWRNRELWAPIYKAQVINTLGAGDASIAGFLAAMLQGQPADRAIRTAAAVGACNVEAPDATSGVQPWAATQARIDAGWEQVQLTAAGGDWVWDEDCHLWVGPRDQTRRH